MARSYEMDMTNGPVLKKLTIFALPLMFSGILQLLFNAADIVIVGKFTGSLALAAVGSTTSLINLLVNLFIGISTGANVLAANFFGSRDGRCMSSCTHTAITLSGIMGIFVGVMGFFLSTPMLELMKTDTEVLPLASLYLRIYFLGAPATVVYNFGAAILRAIGDTDRPLRYLLISGIVNVILNLITVVGLHLGVAGVAIATVVSQYVSATLVIMCLVNSEGIYKLCPKKLKIEAHMLAQILKLGIPAGLQSTFFSLSNVIIQSSINSFGSVAMAANSAAANLEGFVYTSMNSFYHATLCFVSQNLGAKRVDRLPRILGTCVLLVSGVGIALGALVYCSGPVLLSLYVSSKDPNRDLVVADAMIRLAYVCLPYFLCGLMEVMCGALRGLGKSWLPMIISVIGACGLRIVWNATIFAHFGTREMLYIAYPVTWFLTFSAHTISYLFTYRNMKKQCI